MKNRNNPGNRKIPIAMIQGVVIMLLICLLICAGVSVLLANGKLETERILPINIISNLLITLIGSYIAGKRVGGQYAIVCLGATAGYILLLILSAALLFDGKFDEIGWRTGACISGGVIACLLCTIRKSKPYRQKR